MGPIASGCCLELERRWEDALACLTRTEQVVDAHLRRLEPPLTRDDTERLPRYAGQLPSLWAAPTTWPQDRKRIVRLLVEEIVETIGEDGTTLEAMLHWSGGAVHELVGAKAPSGETRAVASPELLALLGTLAAEFSDAQIAGILNRRGLPRRPT